MDNDIKKEEKNAFTRWSMASIAFELGFIIAIPLVVMGFLGKWADLKLNTYPWLTLVGIIIAIISSTFWLTRRFRELLK
jgi:undecaprenyl pyrophosphate phosphatase UppP